MLARRSALPVRKVCVRPRRPGDGDAGVTGRIAVAVAGRSGRAGFGQRPGGVETFAQALRQQRGVGLTRGPHAFRFHVVEADLGERRRAGPV